MAELTSLLNFSGLGASSKAVNDVVKYCCFICKAFAHKLKPGLVCLLMAMWTLPKSVYNISHEPVLELVVVVVVVDVMSPSGVDYMGRGQMPREVKFVSLEGESGFPSLPHEVDSHFIGWRHHSKAAVVAHSWQTGRCYWLSLLPNGSRWRTLTVDVHCWIAVKLHRFSMSRLSDFDNEVTTWV